MRVLFLVDSGSPVGGAELLTLTLRDAMRERGIDARIFASTSGCDAGVSSADYQCYGTDHKPLQAFVRTFNVGAYRKLKRVLAEFQPDVVHARMFLMQLSPSVLPLIRRYPALYHADYLEVVCPTGLKMLPDLRPCRVRAGLACLQNGCVRGRAWPALMAQRALFRRWRSAFDVFVPSSERVKQMLAEDGIDSTPVLPSCVPVVEERPPLSDPPTVACAARLVPEKGVDVLISAMAQVVARVPTARLLLAGDGPQRQALEQQAADLGVADQVSFLGRVRNADLGRVFSAAWVQAIPSRWIEAFGLVAAEASMRGTAVVASRSGGLAEIVRHGETGLLVEPNDAPGLANALLTILIDREVAERMGRAGRQCAMNEYRPAVCVERFLSVYESIAPTASATQRKPMFDARRFATETPT
jgi:glycosyltransferase involved in cell wall biosynthesis